MADVEFSWNPAKARTNLKKHGVSFQEATTVFLDEFARLIDDPDHSEDEERFIIVGLSSNLRILTVCHCYREKRCNYPNFFQHDEQPHRNASIMGAR